MEDVEAGEQNNKNRTCGKCVECCVLIGVSELDKPPLTRCDHLRSIGGCSVYKTRPPSCRGFECMWLMGVGDRTDRPDKLGVMFMAAQAKFGMYVQAWSRRAGAFEKKRVKDIVAGLSKKAVVIRFSKDSRELLGGPRKQLLKLEEVAKSGGTK